MKACVARTRWAARCVVLGRGNSAAIATPCVLASPSPIAPDRRSVIVKGALGGQARSDEAARSLRDLRHAVARVLDDRARLEWPPHAAVGLGQGDVREAIGVVVACARVTVPVLGDRLRIPAVV